ncbi:hypothetical protein [Thalassospira aquimaris]|uniref:Right handed beta helix domain-containing protein n=1 Tax=Thalassospira aquimaris TaxID=3037796 RepID=A0ABT6GGC8_9PROT|nr:hypothetical protein [Thalassospira sp. FZY0004]MDG4721151.1 hypothetical protein [Thalassospira sp. FZY0004]
MRIADFDTWREGAGGDIVAVYDAGTDELADIYYDEAASIAAPNPITLTSDSSGRGKFPQPVYVLVTFYLTINDVNQSGAQRIPIVDLSGEDISEATVSVDAETPDIAMRDILKRTVYATSYGSIGTNAAVNTATITAAIGAASAQGGGRVVLPAGAIKYNTLEIPGFVHITGQGEDITVLQSSVGDRTIELTGDNAGLLNCTLDGLTSVPSSTALYGKALSSTSLSNVKIKRFETGVHFHGAERTLFDQVSVDGCDTAAKLHGDTDAPGDGQGSALTQFVWRGGVIRDCTTTGIDLAYVDAVVEHCHFEDLTFIDDVGDALHIKGAKFLQFKNCQWSGGTDNNVKIEDDDDDTTTENKVRSVRFIDGKMSEGTCVFDGECRDIIFDRFDFKGVTFDPSLPERLITLRDCVEDADVEITGDSVRIARATTSEGGSSGITSDAVATEAWTYPLEPGQVAYVEGKILAKQQNGKNIGVYHVSATFLRNPAQLNFDNQTADFTVGQIVTDETSGATARIVGQSDSGGSGYIELTDIRGIFLNNATISDPEGGEALVNGSLVEQNVTIKGAQASIRADVEDVAGWGVALNANGGEIRLQVTGAASTIIEWTSHMNVVTT